LLSAVPDRLVSAPSTSQELSLSSTEVWCQTL
jgi:hypothetical protein